MPGSALGGRKVESACAGLQTLKHLRQQRAPKTPSHAPAALFRSREALPRSQPSAKAHKQGARCKAERFADRHCQHLVERKRIQLRHAHRRCHSRAEPPVKGTLVTPASVSLPLPGSRLCGSAPTVQQQQCQPCSAHSVRLSHTPVVLLGHRPLPSGVPGRWTRTVREAGVVSMAARRTAAEAPSLREA